MSRYLLPVMLKTTLWFRRTLADLNCTLMSFGCCHDALLVSANQAFRGCSESGWLSQKARKCDRAMIRTTQNTMFPNWEQAVNRLILQPGCNEEGCVKIPFAFRYRNALDGFSISTARVTVFLGIPEFTPNSLRYSSVEIRI